MCDRNWQSIAAMLLAVVMLIAPMQIARADSFVDFEYEVTASDTVTITNYTGPGGAALIPSTLGGKQVASIGEMALQDWVDVTSVTLPSGVREIGDYSFYGCSGPTSLTIPTSMKVIGRLESYRRDAGVEHVIVLGGAGVVPAALEDSLQAALGGGCNG